MKRTVNFRLLLAFLAVACMVVPINGASVQRAEPSPENTTNATSLPPGNCYFDDNCPTVHYCYIIEGRNVGDCRLTWWIVFIGVIVGIICIPWFIIIFSIVMAIISCVVMVVGRVAIEIVYCIFHAFYYLGKEMAKSCDCNCCKKSSTLQPLSKSSSSSSLASWEV